MVHNEFSRGIFGNTDKTPWVYCYMYLKTTYTGTTCAELPASFGLGPMSVCVHRNDNNVEQAARQIVREEKSQQALSSQTTELWSSTVSSLHEVLPMLNSLECERLLKESAWDPTAARRNSADHVDTANSVMGYMMDKFMQEANTEVPKFEL